MSLPFQKHVTRRMRATDIAQCVSLVAGNPVLAARYGPLLGGVGHTWTRLFDCEQPPPVLFEEVARDGSVLWGIGISAFVHDDFLRDLKAAPHFWIGPELTRRCMGGSSPLLSDREIRRANSCDGLNLVVWEACTLPAYAARQDAYDTMIAAFVRYHRGFLLREMIAHQADSGIRLRQTLNTGGRLWRPRTSCWSDLAVGEHPDAIASAPHVVGVTRPSDPYDIGSWVNTLFQHTPPRLALSTAQQRLLLAAEDHLSDEQLTRELNLSLSAVKKTWQTIYSRIGERMPDLIEASSSEARRGREKRHRVLAYMTSHPEELRPRARAAR